MNSMWSLISLSTSNYHWNVLHPNLWLWLLSQSNWRKREDFQSFVDEAVRISICAVLELVCCSPILQSAPSLSPSSWSSSSALSVFVPQVSSYCSPAELNTETGADGTKYQNSDRHNTEIHKQEKGNTHLKGQRDTKPRWKWTQIQKRANRLILQCR